jgi:hypothetical protein
VLIRAYGLIVVAALFVVPMIPTGSQVKSCTSTSIYSSGCPNITPEITEKSVDLSGKNGGRGKNPPPPDQTGAGGRPPRVATAPHNASQTAPGCDPDAYYDCFEIIEPIDPVAPEAPVTLDDLASFVPVDGAPHMEPTGWSVAGLPTNFWITTSAHVVDGELFGRPASVRFTPVAADYDYGDGSAAVRMPLGSSWAASGAAEFSSTTTSHTYANTGVYTVTVGVDYAVEYSYNGSTWVPVEGTLTSTSPPLTAQIVRANTVIVSTDCATDPTGIGC